MNVAHPKTAEQRIHKPIMADIAQTGMWLTNDNVSPRMTEMQRKQSLGCAVEMEL
jgi:hypothetical protein